MIHPNLCIRAEEPPLNFNNLRDIAVVLAGSWMWTWRDLVDRLGWAQGWVFAPIGVAFLAGIAYVLLALRCARRESYAEQLLGL